MMSPDYGSVSRIANKREPAGSMVYIHSLPFFFLVFFFLSLFFSELLFLIVLHPQTI